VILLAETKASQCGVANGVDGKRVSPLGARASNAGDQYQELWALQQALGLLDPSTGLTVVTVEGVASETAEGPRESTLLGSRTSKGEVQRKPMGTLSFRQGGYADT
jgi:hypothetical protein